MGFISGPSIEIFLFGFLIINDFSVRVMFLLIKVILHNPTKKGYDYE